MYVGMHTHVCICVYIHAQTHTLSLTHTDVHISYESHHIFQWFPLIRDGRYLMNNAKPNRLVSFYLQSLTIVSSIVLSTIVGRLSTIVREMKPNGSVLENLCLTLVRSLGPKKRGLQAINLMNNEEKHASTTSELIVFEQ